MYFSICYILKFCEWFCLSVFCFFVYSYCYFLFRFLILLAFSCRIISSLNPLVKTFRCMFRPTLCLPILSFFSLLYFILLFYIFISFYFISCFSFIFNHLTFANSFPFQFLHTPNYFPYFSVSFSLLLLLSHSISCA